MLLKPGASVSRETGALKATPTFKYAAPLAGFAAVLSDAAQTTLSHDPRVLMAVPETSIDTPHEARVCTPSAGWLGRVCADRVTARTAALPSDAIGATLGTGASRPVLARRGGGGKVFDQPGAAPLPVLRSQRRRALCQLSQAAFLAA